MFTRNKFFITIRSDDDNNNNNNNNNNQNTVTLSNAI